MERMIMGVALLILMLAASASTPVQSAVGGVPPPICDPHGPPCK